MKHHYYPEFCLKRWQSGQDQKVQFFHKGPHGDLVTGRAKPKYICQKTNLYAFENVAPENRHHLETTFFAEEIDSPASQVLNKLEADGTETLTWNMRVSWAKFLLALPARTPYLVDQLGPTLARQFIDNEEEEYLSMKGPADPPRLSEWAEKHRPGLLNNRVKTLIPTLIDNDVHIANLLKMDWWTRRVVGHELLTSDSPLVAHPHSNRPNAYNLAHPDCTLVLPLGPNLLFVASAAPGTRQRLRRTSHRRVAWIVNNAIVRQRTRFVYARDARLTDFVRRHVMAESIA